MQADNPLKGGLSVYMVSNIWATMQGTLQFAGVLCRPVLQPAWYARPHLTLASVNSTFTRSQLCQLRQTHLNFISSNELRFVKWSYLHKT